MKIAILSAFYPFRGGIAQFNANLYQALCREHDVFPFTFTRQYPAFLFPGKTQYVTPDDDALPVPSLPVLDTANPFLYLSAAKRIEATGPDVLIMKYWMSYFAPSLGTVARRLRKKGCRVVTILDNVIPHERRLLDRSLTGWFIKQNSGFVAMSQSVQRDLLTLYPDARCLLQPHPLYNHFGDKIDTVRARQELGLDPGKKTLLFFGLIRDYKGLDLLISAMDHLDDSYQLLVAGESYGSFLPYAQQIQQARWPNNIKVLNRYIADKEVPMLFSAADVCVLPYRSATQSGITSIAYHFETPLIATDTGGLKESIQAPGTGLMVEEISSHALAKVIRQFYSQNRNGFVENIRRQKKALSWEVFAHSLLSFSNTL